ncbi:MAG: hypothetical protein Q9204_006140 [Flavoplaca sp. TL-2023a]
MAYSIASIRKVFEQARLAAQENATKKEFAALQISINNAETQIEEYLRNSSQKLLFAPEYCTSRMMDNLQKDRKQRLNHPALLPAEPTEEDVEIVKAYEPAFEGQLIVAIEMFESMMSMRDLLRQYKLRNTPNLSLENAGPPQLIITSFETYTFRNRDVGKEHQMDESEKLKAHHAAMHEHSKLLTSQLAIFGRSSFPSMISNMKQETKHLVQKVRGWEKELTWGVVALQLAKESRVLIVIN